MLKPLLENLSSLVFPAECTLCGAALNPNPPSGVCHLCDAGIRRIASPHCPGCGRTLTGPSPRCAACHDETYAFDRAFACAYYEGAMRELIHIYKFQYRKYLKHFFTTMARQFIQSHLSMEAFDMVLPVPAGPERRRERGFNPPELISEEIAKDLELPHRPAALLRTRSESSQALLAKPGRIQNVKGAFSVKRQDAFHLKHLLLIDDILTTGETASECARTLKNAGASSVTVLALARGV